MNGPPCAGCDECAPRGVRASSCPPFVIDRDVSSTSPSADEADERDDRNDGFSSIGSAALTSSPPESTELMCAAPPEPMHIPPPRVVNARSAAQFPPHSWFWYPETAQLLPLSPLVNPLFDPDRHEVLHLPPSSYVGPYHPADKEHEHDFIRAQRCVEGCPYRVEPSVKPVRIREHIAKCAYRKTLAVRLGAADPLARLCRLQVDAMREKRSKKAWHTSSNSNSASPEVSRTPSSSPSLRLPGIGSLIAAAEEGAVGAPLRRVDSAPGSSTPAAYKPHLKPW